MRAEQTAANKSTKTPIRSIVAASIVVLNPGFVAMPADAAVKHKHATHKHIDTTSLSALCGLAKSFCRTDVPSYNHIDAATSSDNGKTFNLTDHGQRLYASIDHPFATWFHDVTSGDVFKRGKFEDWDGYKNKGQIIAHTLDQDKVINYTGIQFNLMPAYLTHSLPQKFGHNAPILAIAASTDETQSDVIKLTKYFSEKGFLPKDGYGVFMRMRDDDKDLTKECVVFHFGAQNADAKLNAIANKGDGCKPFYDAIARHPMEVARAKAELARQQAAEAAAIAKDKQLIQQYLQAYADTNGKLAASAKIYQSGFATFTAAQRGLFLAALVDPASFIAIQAASNDRAAINALLTKVHPSPAAKVALVTALATLNGAVVPAPNPLAVNPMIMSADDVITLSGLIKDADKVAAQQVAAHFDQVSQMARQNATNQKAALAEAKRLQTKAVQPKSIRISLNDKIKQGFNTLQSKAKSLGHQVYASGQQLAAATGKAASQAKVTALDFFNRHSVSATVAAGTAAVVAVGGALNSVLAFLPPLPFAPQVPERLRPSFRFAKRKENESDEPSWFTVPTKRTSQPNHDAVDQAMAKLVKDAMQVTPALLTKAKPATAAAYVTQRFGEQKLAAQAKQSKLEEWQALQPRINNAAFMQSVEQAMDTLFTTEKAEQLTASLRKAQVETTLAKLGMKLPSAADFSAMQEIVAQHDAVQAKAMLPRKEIKLQQKARKLYLAEHKAQIAFDTKALAIVAGALDQVVAEQLNLRAAGIEGVAAELDKPRGRKVRQPKPERKLPISKGAQRPTIRSAMRGRVKVLAVA